MLLTWLEPAKFDGCMGQIQDGLNSDGSFCQKDAILVEYCSVVMEES